VSASADEDEGSIIDAPVAQNGLMCFLNAERECGADCMAYTLEGTESKTMGLQQKNCLLLISVERMGRYAGNIASAANKMQQRSATEAADRVRLGVNPPPDPRGPKS
jgi:hypothetical protein